MICGGIREAIRKATCWAPPMPPLTQELRVWRAEVADVAGIPVFMILTNRQLRDIVRVRPASLAALGGISGIGQARLQKYGRVLLDRVRGGAAPLAEPWSAPMSGPDGAVAGTPVLTPTADAGLAAVPEQPGSAPTADPSPEIPSHA